MRSYNFIVTVLLVISLTAFFEQAASDIVTEDTCSSLTNQTTCCAEDGCYFLSCVNKTEESQTHTGCHKKGEDITAICKEGSNSSQCSEDPTTQQPTTTAAPDVCKDKSKEDCCDTADDGCIFLSCNGTDDKPHIGCHMPSTKTSEFCKNADEANNMCKETTGPTPSPTPTAAPPTAAPAPVDVCTNYTNQTVCCQHSGDNCFYAICTDLKDKPHTGCHGHAADLSTFCKNVSQVTDKCKESLSTTPAVTTTTKAPDANANTGTVEEHGQHFDGASFIGGFVLCAGLVAITWFGLKFYKAKTERNYHTL